MELTPLEIEQIRASNVAVGLQVHGEVWQLVVRGNECSIGVSDETLPREVRLQALQEMREINASLGALGELLGASGISA
jgi:hypothetical protein|tara:strand:- start:1671 stop:1907 length:237 start_codon:yes stop_codon:yes gene_type:complete